MPRPILRVALPSIVAALALIGVAAVHPARAADTLQVVAATTYQLLPDQGRVHVRIDATATSHEPDTDDGRVITGLTFSVQPGIANLVATSDGTRLAARITQRTDEFTDVELTFGQPLHFEDSYRYRVSFDLVDPGGAAGRDIRIGRSVVAFPAWAFGSSNVPGGSVRIDVPAGYNVSVEGTQMASSGGGDQPTTLRAERLPDPFAFFAYISADRPGAFSETPLSVSLGDRTATINVRAWEDDPAWGSRMQDLLRDGLPALRELIGLDYTLSGSLSVEEAATSRLGEYAGIFNDIADTITIRYDADAYVALHEAAHIWFNEKLFPERWIGEAFAEFYAVQAGKEIGATGETFELDDAALKHRIPLNSWGDVGVEDLAVEDYAYAATYHLATLIAGRTDLAGLRTVWKAAADDELSYLPTHAGVAPGVSIAVTQQGWQRLLDLLEERTGTSYTDLWDEWVVADADRPLLAERTAARGAYAATVRRAGDWELPQRIRYDLGSWSFDAATAEIAAANDVLGQRDRIASAASALDLTPPPTLESAFEGGGGLRAAADEANAELTTLDAISDAGALLAIEPSTLESIGLWGEQPQQDLDAARTAFEAADLGAADDAAARLMGTRGGAQDAGRQRVAIAGGGLLGLDGLIMAGLALRRRRLRRRMELLRARVHPTFTQ
ncbi:MAG TPA: hypothetical protein VFX74_06395 [Candidatus Limnocylindria bacterium]|nr:hypothetical protein [Candidatus Limnocylindria bacterium]